MSDWDTDKENLIRFWKEEANILIWLNSNAGQYYKLVNKIISIPCILISAVSSTTILSNMEPENSTILLVIGSVLAFGTFLQSLKEFLNLDQKITQYDYNIKANRILILDIEELLYQDKEDRESANKFIKKIKERKKELLINTPIIPNFIKNKLKKAIQNNDILDIMNKSILYNYLKNQVVEAEPSIFNNEEVSLLHSSKTLPNYTNTRPNYTNTSNTSPNQLSTLSTPVNNNSINNSVAPINTGSTIIDIEMQEDNRNQMYRNQVFTNLHYL
jgi:hypothetical protein